MGSALWVALSGLCIGHGPCVLCVPLRRAGSCMLAGYVACAKLAPGRRKPLAQHQIGLPQASRQPALDNNFRLLLFYEQHRFVAVSHDLDSRFGIAYGAALHA